MQHPRTTRHLTSPGTTPLRTGWGSRAVSAFLRVHQPAARHPPGVVLPTCCRRAGAWSFTGPMLTTPPRLSIPNIDCLVIYPVACLLFIVSEESPTRRIYTKQRFHEVFYPTVAARTASLRLSHRFLCITTAVTMMISTLGASTPGLMDMRKSSTPTRVHRART